MTEPNIKQQLNVRQQHIKAGDGTYSKHLAVVHLTPIYKKNTQLKCTHISSRKYPGFLQNCIRYFIDYSDKTTIHGFKYLTERGRSLTEKLYWATALVMSLCICVTLVLNVYQKWINSPILVTFANSETRISEIPFPAITICPEVKSNKLLFNYTDIYYKIGSGQNLTAIEQQHFSIISLVCWNTLRSKNRRKTSTEAVRIFMEVGLHVEDYVYAIKWNGINVSLNAKDVFSPILTFEGLCYTFNLLDRRDIFHDLVIHHEDELANVPQSSWSPETGYSVDGGPYPRRTLTAGTDGGLVISLRLLEEQCDYICGDTLQGYKVALHQPSELPRITENFFRVSLGHSVVAAITPNMITTSDILLNYNHQDRKCYYTKEKSLKFFKIYNLHNCLIECLTNFTFEMCHCVAFYMPRANVTPTCGFASRTCCMTAREIFFAKVNISDEGDEEEIHYLDDCRCLPACHSLNFDVETSETEMDLHEKLILYEASKLKNGYYSEASSQKSRFVESELNLFFKDARFRRLERTALYGHTDFWARVGGLLGLFTGFSILSLIEILYYLTVRLFYNFRIFGRRYWAGTPELLNRIR